MTMPDPPASAFLEGVGGKGAGRWGVPQWGHTGPGIVSGTAVYVHGGSHRSVCVCGLPPQRVTLLDSVRIRHWLQHSLTESVPEAMLARHGMSVAAVMDSLVDVNHNHNARSGSGRGLGSLAAELRVAIFRFLDCNILEMT